MNRDEKIEELTQQVQHLSVMLRQYQQELNQVQEELASLSRKPEVIDVATLDKSKVPPVITPPQDYQKPPVLQPKPVVPQPKEQRPVKKEAFPDSNLEDFIGGNVLSKIGIGVLIIGLGIFVKFAIDNNLINPLTRIILAYLAGLTLLGLAYRLKSKYPAYSAVLLSGGVATLYFTTFIAFDFFSLFSRITAFVLMVLISGYTVFAAVRQYRQEIIGLIGLIGAYAVPVLLSDGTGSVAVLLAYIALIDAVMLFIAYRINWNVTPIVAFVCTWLIFVIEFLSSSKMWELSLVFFLLFYVQILAKKLLKKIPFAAGDGLYLFANSLLFYVTQSKWLDDYPTAFTIGNAIFHGLVAFGVYRLQPENKKLFYNLIALSLLFLTAALPIRFEGGLLPVLWASEAALLFTLGRTQKIQFYETGSYIVLFLTLVATTHYWEQEYGYEKTFLFFLINPVFATSLLVSALLGLINWVHFRFPSSLTPTQQNLADHVFFGLLLLAGYVSVMLEINHFYANDPGLHILWLFNFSALYGLMLLGLALQFIRHPSLDNTVTAFVMLLGMSFLLGVLPVLEELRDQTIQQRLIVVWQVRYLSYGLVIALFLLMGVFTNRFLPVLKNTIAVVLHLILLTILSNELLNLLVWQNPAHLEEAKDTAYKTGFSILWAVYSFGLIIYGFWKQRQLWRFMGIVLFGITLLKIVFWDIQYTTAISKIIVFISLGVLLLLVSFLYQKFKHIILSPDKPPDNQAGNPPEGSAQT